MILEMDFGNSRIKWRIKNAVDVVVRGVAGREAGLEKIAIDLSSFVSMIDQVRIVSVWGESAKEQIAEWVKLNLNCMAKFAISQDKCAGVKNGYDDPSALGVDRWLAIVAGFHYCQSACIVVSCGTAMTVDLINHQGIHLGGYIVPGWMLSISVLSNSTRLINLTENRAWQLSPGTYTQSAVDNGLAACFKGLVENAIAQLGTQIQSGRFTIIATGGDAGRLQEILPEVVIREELIMDGLAYCK